MTFHRVFPFSVTLSLPEASRRGRQRAGQRSEDITAIARSKQVFTGAFRVRHQSHDIPFAIADAGNVLARTIWVRGLRRFSLWIAIAKYDSVLSAQFVERRIVTDKVSIGMGDRHAQHAARLQLMREGCAGALYSYVYVVADKVQISISNQRSWKQAGLTQDLKTIANAQHQIAFCGKRFHRIHDGGKTGQRSSAQIVAVRKAAGNDQGIVTAQVRIAVPDKIDRLSHLF